MMDETATGTQILLAFNKYEHVDFDLYEPEQNQQALQHCQSIISDKDHKNVYLWGQAGTGKSHLLQALCSEAAREELNIAYIPLLDADRLSPHKFPCSSQPNTAPGAAPYNWLI